MLCPKCGKETSDETAFCSTCGAELKEGSSPKERNRSGRRWRRITWAVIALVALVVLVITFLPRGEKVPEKTYSEVIAMVEAGEVQEVIITDQKSLTITTTEGREFKSTIATEDVSRFIALLQDVGISFDTVYSNGFDWIWVVVGVGAVLLSGFLGYSIGRGRVSK